MICVGCNCKMSQNEGKTHIVYECENCGLARKEPIDDEIIEMRQQWALLESRYGRSDPHHINDYWFGKTFAPVQARW